MHTVPTSSPLDRGGQTSTLLSTSPFSGSSLREGSTWGRIGRNRVGLHSTGVRLVVRMQISIVQRASCAIAESRCPHRRRIYRSRRYRDLDAGLLRRLQDERRAGNPQPPTSMLDVAGQHVHRRANLVAWARVFWGCVQKMLQHTIATIGHHSLTITVRIAGTKSVYRVQDAWPHGSVEVGAARVMNAGDSVTRAPARATLGGMAWPPLKRGERSESPRALRWTPDVHSQIQKQLNHAFRNSDGLSPAIQLLLSCFT